jgi:amino acid adenylation domain-containing protein/thioester reductase-like protein
MPLPLVVRELPDGRCADRRKSLQEEIDREAAEPFDLTHGPLVRARLIRVEEETQVFCLTLHHLISDGRSLDLLLEDLGDLYCSFSAGRSPPRAREPGDYLEFAAAERAAASAGVHEQGKAFWSRALTGVEAVEMPTEKGHSVLSDRDAVEAFLTVPDAIAQRLEEIARECSSSLYLVLLTVFSGLLARWTGQQDIVVGTPVANRRSSAVEQVVGLFVNSVAMRSRIDEDESLRQLVRRLRPSHLEALDHGDVPFDHVVDELEADRAAGLNPIFQLMFALQSGEPARLRLDGLGARALHPRIAKTRFGLECTCWRERTGLRVRLNFAGERFDEAAGERFLGHFGRFLEGVATDPNAPIGTVPILAEEEERDLLGRTNPLSSPDLDSDVATLFERQAERVPEAIALIAGRDSLSYAELDATANAVAAGLRRYGVGPGSIVGVCLKRSPMLVAALLGALKLGAGFLPLDAAAPASRLRQLLSVCPCDVVIADDRRDLDVEVLSAHEIPRSGGRPSPDARSPDSLAYVIQTSGTSGLPKAVQILQRNAVNTLIGCREWFGFVASDVFLCIAAHTFDIFYFELLSPLLCGGTSLLVDRSEIFDPAELVPLLRRATVVQAVPSLMERLLHALRHAGETAPDMRYAITGGDLVHRSLLARIATVFPAATPTVLYGPTEAAMVCAGIKLEGPVTGDHPIGTPLPNVGLRLYDHRRRLVPIGCAGEIYIGGAGVAAGYMGADDGDSFVELDGQRFYRSGDRARWLSDGGLSFLGRVDDQLKVRGFRIEPTEVEAVLEAVPEISTAAVVSTGAGSSRRLAAFVVPEAERTIRDAARRRHRTYWHELFEATHSTPLPGSERDFTGWRSSYSGELIPDAEMVEWVDSAAAEIRESLPKGRAPRVLELGAGTGLLLSALAPECDRYLATDPSPQLVSRLEDLVQVEGMSMAEVRMMEASELTNLNVGRFDAVVLNSVSQYFPDLSYLEEVVRAAVARLRPGGFVFVGDVRSLPLRRTFWTSVALSRPGMVSESETAKANVRRDESSERELLVDPRFFVDLERRIEGVGVVDVMPRRGRCSNEMTKYRYNAVLNAGTPGDREPMEWVEWSAAGMDLSRLGRLLADSDRSPLCFAAVPNALLRQDVLERRRVWGEAGVSFVEAVHPQELRDLAAFHGYGARLSWRAGDSDGCFDVFLWRGGREERGRWAWPDPISPVDGDGLANDPLLPLLAEPLRQKATAVVEERLPHYMVPAIVHCVERLPVGANAKVDRRALSAVADALGSPESSKAEPPSSPTEKTLGRVWCELLGLDAVYRDTSFFAVGGTSLVAIEMAVRLRAAGIRVSGQDVFRHQTLERLGAAIDRGGDGAAARDFLTPTISTAAAKMGVAKRAPLRLAEEVLLTGATGYLGIHLLRGLLERGQRVVCLLRGAGDEAAERRLVEQWRWYFGQRHLPMERVKVVVGDLACPRLGLSAERWESLASCCDHVINAAADVRHVAAQKELFAVNRDGARRLIDLACAGAGSALHQISTVGVAGTVEARGQPAFSEDSILVGQVATEDYSASKLAAELEVRAFFEQGGVGTVMRVGTLGPSSTSARFQRNATDHFLIRYLSSTIRLSLGSEWPERRIDLAPVDFVASAVLSLADREGTNAGETFHIVNPHGLAHGDLIRILRKLGYPIQTVDRADYAKLVMERALEMGLEEAVGGLLPLIDPAPGFPLAIDAGRSTALLAELGLRCPPPSPALIVRFMERLMDLGHLPKPPVSSIARDPAIDGEGGGDG